MQTIRLPVASAGRGVYQSDMAVALHQAMSSDPTKPTLEHEPILHSGCAPVLLRDLGMPRDFSSSSFINGAGRNF
eukprot:4493261-Pyramimonas_sp.AAC.2